VVEDGTTMAVEDGTSSTSVSSFMPLLVLGSLSSFLALLLPLL